MKKFKILVISMMILSFVIVGVGFAFLPTHDFITGEYFWLERYYVYDDTRFLYKSRKSLYKSKSEFFTALKT